MKFPLPSFFRLWYQSCIVLCMMMISGCLYIPPTEPLEENSPPEFLHSDPPAGEILRLTLSASRNVFVVVQDLDLNDTLRFQWYISGIGILGPGESLLQDDFIGSKIELNNADSSWHNRSLFCVVYDDSNATNSISWTIEILEEN